MLSGSELVFAGLAAAAAGLVNAIAGGGTLISFPTLAALGLTDIVANITNTVASARAISAGRSRRERSCRTKEAPYNAHPSRDHRRSFRGHSPPVYQRKDLPPACPIPYPDRRGTACDPGPVRNWIRLHTGHDGTDGKGCRNAALPVSLAAVYGGYFGPYLSVIILAVLGLFLDDTLTRLNALKQCISFATNIAAALFFLFSALFIRPLALIMAVGALIGGAVGGRIAGRITPNTHVARLRVGRRQGRGPAQATGRRVRPGVAALYNGRAALSHPTYDPNFLGSYWLAARPTYRLRGLRRGSRQGNVFFAGEHCDVPYQGFMEGAARTGTRAARQILADLASARGRDERRRRPARQLSELLGSPRPGRSPCSGPR